MTSNDPFPNRPRPHQPQGDGQPYYWHNPSSADDAEARALPFDGEPHYVVEEHPADAPVYPTYPTAQYPALASYPQGQYPAAGQYPTGQYPSAPHPGQDTYPVTAQYPGLVHPAYGSPSYYGGGYPNPYAGYLPPTAPPPAPPSKTRRALLAIGAAALAAGLVLSGVAIAQSREGSSGTVASPPAIGNGNTGNGNTGNGGAGTGGSTGNGAGSGNQGIFPGGPGSTSGNGTSASAAVATKTQQVGIVTIVSVLGTQSAESAGTGMVLTSSGEILTNNHVINGATSITVTVGSTGRSYRADVVGTAPTKDVAVLQLRNASGLATAKIDTSQDVAVGDAVTGVGNAGGTGTLRAATGKVTALGQSITATDESGQNAEKLTGLIETDAGIIAGDSGGPLYTSDGAIIGMDTAASTDSQNANAYAIPITTATSIASQIESGQASSVIHIGLPAFIGVYVSTSTTAGGAGVEQVVPGDPADKAGITAGSVITGVDNTRVTSPTQLKTALAAYKPGQTVKLTWTDTSGQTQSGSATLVAGPAD